MEVAGLSVKIRKLHSTFNFILTRGAPVQDMAISGREGRSQEVSDRWLVRAGVTCKHLIGEHTCATSWDCHPLRV